MYALASVSLMLALAPLGMSAAAATLPQVERPNFSAGPEVIASLDAMIARLQAAAEADPSSWQAGRALGNCKEVRRTIAQWPDIGAAYSPRGAERLWSECKSTYEAVR